MKDLWYLVAELGTELHPDRIAAVANKIESLESLEQFGLVKPGFGPGVDSSMINRLEMAWRDAKEIGPKEMAAALRVSSAVSELQKQRSSVRLVWTGPSTDLVPVRHTEQVLCEVIQSAKKRIFLVSFVAYEVPTIMKALRDAIERDVQVNVLLESPVDKGGRVTVDSIATMKEKVPFVNVYVWQASDKKAVSGHWGGAVHAKCAVCDERLAFITSANLSVAAMERNMEIGVLIKGGNLPEELHRHLEVLVATEIVTRI